MEDRKIYILFTDTGTLFTRLIKIYTRESYNHVSIAFDDQLEEIYSFGRKKPTNPFIGGFIREKLKEGLFKRAKCVIYSCHVSEQEYKKMRAKVKKIEREKEKYRYNLIGLLAIILHFNLNRKNAFFCSQFVATILNEKKGLLMKPPGLTTPRDLMNLNEFNFVYQGMLHTYPVPEELAVTHLERIPGRLVG